MEESNSVQNLEVSDNQEQKKDVVAYETYRKTVGEVKKLKPELRAKEEENLELKRQVELYEQQKAESEGRKDDVIKSLRDKIVEVETERSTIKKNYAWNALSAQIKSEAIKQGCVNPDKLIRLMPEEDLKGIDINDEFMINSEDLERVIAKAKADNSDIGLFGMKKVNVNDVKNPGLPQATEEKLTPQEAIRAQLKKSLGA